MLKRNWLIGYRIAEEELQRADRAEYGARIIAKLAKKLTAEYLYYVKKEEVKELLENCELLSKFHRSGRY